MGREDRQPTDDEVTRMQEIIRRGMDDGALGLSSGIVYVPAVYAFEDIYRIRGALQNGSVQIPT